jgi:N-acetylglucosaminyl-diphospho-decaprenol L-rhamnosyltransferase
VSELAIVTVVHDSASELTRLLTSIDRFLDPRPHVVVVDSGSGDGGGQVARDRGADVVTLSQNLGFGAGCNAGLERVTAPVTALLNPDVELLDAGLGRLVAEAAAGNALLVPRLLNPDGSTQDSAHPLPGTLEALIPAAIPKPLLPPPLRRRYEPWRSSAPRRVGWAIAACLVARTELLRRLGPFDPTAFLFYEDLDLCLRAADQGIPTLLRPAVALRHEGGTSVGRALAGRDLELNATRRREVMSRRGRAALALDDAAETLTYAVRFAGRRLLRRGGDYERAQLRALRAARDAAARPPRD